MADSTLSATALGDGSSPGRPSAVSSSTARSRAAARPSRTCHPGLSGRVETRALGHDGTLEGVLLRPGSPSAVRSSIARQGRCAAPAPMAHEGGCDEGGTNTIIYQTIAL